MNPKRVQNKTWLEISSRALKSNLRLLRQTSKPAEVMAVVKANAYGHGLLEVASVMKTERVKWFGVDHVDEALCLRRAGFHQGILVLGFTPTHRVRDLVSNDISFVAYDQRVIREAARVASANHPANIHLKVETGLYRQGLPVEELVTLARYAMRQRHVGVEGLSTHYANIEDTSDPSHAKKQLSVFKKAIVELEKEGIRPRWKHTSCSAAALLYPETHFNLVRTGIALYGLWPSAGVRNRSARKGKLVPALTWKTIVAQVKEVPAGASVGYGLTHRFKHNATIAILPIGYSDGYDRVAESRRGEALVHGKRCPIVGRICMNICMADVTCIKKTRVGDEVVLIGRQGRGEVSADDLADLMGSINYEVVSRINPLIQRCIL